jgi:hypothetical protein
LSSLFKVCSPVINELQRSISSGDGNWNLFETEEQELLWFFLFVILFLI